MNIKNIYKTNKTIEMNNWREPDKKYLIDQIEQIFTSISLYIKRRGKKGDHSTNVFLEEEFITIYNIIFDDSFEKCKGPNYPGIDLKSINNNMAIQVSSDATVKKIKETVLKCYKNKDKLNISKLKFFFLSQETSKLSLIILSEIEDFLNKPSNRKKIFGKDESLEYPIKINPRFFNPKLDIKSFDFIQENHHQLNSDKLRKILTKLQELWPLFKITSEDFQSFYLSIKGNSLNIELNNLPNNDSIYYIIQKFLPIRIIPDFILVKLNYSGKRIGEYISGVTLITDNEQLYNDVKSQMQEDSSILIDFLLRNKIQEIKKGRSSGFLSIKRSEISNVKCKICAYYKFNFDIETIRSSYLTNIDINSLDEAFYRAFVLAEYGNYLSSIQQYKVIWEFCKREECYFVAKFVCLYNLKRLKNSYYLKFLENSPFKDLSVELINEIDADLTTFLSASITKEESVLPLNKCEHKKS